MAFKKGNKDGQGRPKGAKNKTTLLGRDIIESYFIEQKGLEQLLNDISNLEDRDKVSAKIKLLEFFIPKQKEIQTNAFDNLRFEILEETEQNNEDSTSEDTNE
jgi:hypothetical protein